MKKRIILLFLLLNLVFKTTPTVAVEVSQLDPYTDEIVVNVYVDSTFQNFTQMKSVLNSYDNLQTAFYKDRTTFKKILKLNITQLSEAEHGLLTNYLHSIKSVNQTNGNEFNSTAFENGRLNESFYGVSGVAFNASKTLQWIADNFWNKITNQYSFYIFNLTEFDVDGKNHWFSIYPTDLDSNKPRTRFYSGASPLLYGREVMGWGGENKLPIQFLDLSAKTWYARFIQSAWGQYGYNATAISKTLADWQGRYQSPGYEEWLQNLFDPIFTELFLEDEWMNYKIEDGSNLYTRIEVPTTAFVNWSIPSLDEAEWVINDSLIKRQFDRDFPWMNFTSSTTWKFLNDDPTLASLLNNRVYYDANTGRYGIDLTNDIVDYIYENILVFTTDPEVISLPSVTFLLPGDMFMSINGFKFAGLSFGTFQIQTMNEEIAYDENGERNIGLSKVYVHEIGHSIGLPHPFLSDSKWSSDFTSTVMGYFPSVSTFSIYDINKVGRVMSMSYLKKLELFSYTPYPELKTEIQNIYDEALQAHKNWDFNKSISLIYYAFDLLENYEPSASTTSTPPPNTTLTPTTTSDGLENSPVESSQNPLIFLYPLWTLFLLPAVINKIRKYHH